MPCHAMVSNKVMWWPECIQPGGEGVLPYIAYTGMCRWTGYGFRPLCPKQGSLRRRRLKGKGKGVLGKRAGYKQGI